MPSLKEERERLKWLIREGKINDDTRVKVVIPSIDVHERIRNERKIRRIQINTDEHGVSQFAAIKEAWMLELEQNPSLFFSAFIAALSTIDVRGYKEAQAEEKADEDFMMGRGGY